MADRATRVKEISDAYVEILRDLNTGNLPEWLQLDLTFQQMKVLYILKQHGSLKMRDLSRELKVTMPTITGIVNRLIDRKGGVALVARMVSPEDRREVWAQLTPVGVEATEMLNHLNARLLASALTQLNEADLESMHGPIARLSEAVKEQQQAALPPPEVTLPLSEVVGVDATLIAIAGGEADSDATVEILMARPALN